MKRIMFWALMAFSFSTFGQETPLGVFAKAFNKANCADEAQVKKTSVPPKEFIQKSYEEASDHANSQTTRVLKKSKDVVRNFEFSSLSFCEESQLAQNAFVELLESFDEIEGLMAKIVDTGDDDSVEIYTIVMKDGTYTTLYFGN